MGLQQCGLRVDSRGKELQAHGSFEFPCAGYAALYTRSKEDRIPWHWHEELEIAHVQSGVLRVQTPGKTVLLRAGDSIFLNSNVPHCATAEEDCFLQSLVFHPMLIAGNSLSVFAKKYVLPLLSCCALDAVPEHGAGSLAEDFDAAFAAVADDAPGFEFLAREHLSRICFRLSQQCAGIPETVSPINDAARVRAMLEFLHTRYAAPITLRELAAVVNISERECLRCFQRSIQLPPMQYLRKYRLMQGAALLRREPSVPISEISSQCGFDSPSYFSKLFRRTYGCTPRDYRSRRA